MKTILVVLIVVGLGLFFGYLAALVYPYSEIYILR
jgi:hypothetical protein